MTERMLMPSETLVDDRSSFTTSNVVRPAPSGSSIQVDGPGMIDTLLVRADSDAYSVRVETDKSELVSADFLTLKSLSDDLQHVSAYTDTGGKSVVVITNYPYQGWSSISIDPNGEVTFDKIRAEWILGLPVSY